jgi:hypothetical protein
MSDEEELELELPEEAAPEDEPEYVLDLKRQIEAERAKRQAAEQKLHQAAREVHSARSEVDDTNLQLVINAIDTVSRDQELMKQAHTYAMQNGDFARATEIQSEMSANAAKLLQLENGKQAMETRHVSQSLRCPQPTLWKTFQAVCRPAAPIGCVATRNSCVTRA